MVASRPRFSRVLDSPPKARRRWLRWLLSATLIFAGGPAVLAVIARTRLVREYTGHEVAAALRRELGLRAQIDEVEVDIGALSVVARGIRLEHPTQGRLARVDTLRIRPSWWALLRGK